MKINAIQRSDGSRRENVYNFIYKNVIDMSMKPGSVLSENEIALQLNVSRTPVREAMIQLAKEDLLDIVPQIGTYVSLIDPTLVEEARFMRATLEIAIIKLAVEKLDYSNYLKLEKSLYMQKEVIKEGNYKDFLMYDDAFHEIIFKSLGKERTWKAIEQMNAHFKRVRLMRLLNTDISEWEEILKEHEDLYSALKNKDSATAVIIIRDHLNKGVYHLSELIAQHPSYFKV